MQTNRLHLEKYHMAHSNYSCNLKTLIIPHSQDVHCTFGKPNYCVWQETRLPVEHNYTCYSLSDLCWHLATALDISVFVTMFVVTWCFTAPVFSSAEWNATGKVLGGRILTTLPWTLVVSAQHLTHPLGWDHRLLTKLPSSPHAAPHIWGVHTQTHTWRQSPCLDSQERLASRCDPG